jgi:hypothetical protein
MDRSGEELGFQTIIIVAIIIISFILIFKWIPTFKETYMSNADYEICKDSNLANAKLKLKAPGTNTILTEREGNKCKTEYVKAPKGEEVPFIAKKMARCWDMYLEGKSDLFQTEDNNYCAFCSVIEFEDKTAQIGGLPNYLLKNKVLGKEKTYYEYLTSISVRNDVLSQFENSALKKLTIDTLSPAAVVYVASKNANPGSLTGKSSGVEGGAFAGVGGVIGGIAGTSIAVGLGLCSTIVGCLLGGGLVAFGGFVTAGTLAGGAAGATTYGLAVGANYDPDRDTKILLIPYEKSTLEKLRCTRLEGQDYLEVKK